MMKFLVLAPFDDRRKDTRWHLAMNDVAVGVGEVWTERRVHGMVPVRCVGPKRGECSSIAPPAAARRRRRRLASAWGGDAWRQPERAGAI